MKSKLSGRRSFLKDLAVGGMADDNPRNTCILRLQITSIDQEQND